MTILQDLAETDTPAWHALGGTSATTSAASEPMLSGWDNRPTWDNSKGGFDNRPSWDNWSKNWNKK
jgi:hypothetical protein